MRNYIKVIIIAILIGASLAWTFYHKIEKEVKVFNDTSNNVYVFQTGVFQSQDNAYKFANGFKSQMVYYDGEYYRVFISAVSKSETLSLMEKYFDELGINYFIKQISMNNLSDDFNNYEKLLMETRNNQAIDSINQKLLDILLTYL